MRQMSRAEPKMAPITIPAMGTLSFLLSSSVESRVLMVDIRVEGARRNNGTAETEEAPRSSIVDARILSVCFYFEIGKSSEYCRLFCMATTSSVAQP